MPRAREPSAPVIQIAWMHRFGQTRHVAASAQAPRGRAPPATSCLDAAPQALPVRSRRICLPAAFHSASRPTLSPCHAQCCRRRVFARQIGRGHISPSGCRLRPPAHERFSNNPHRYQKVLPFVRCSRGRRRQRAHAMSCPAARRTRQAPPAVHTATACCPNITVAVTAAMNSGPRIAHRQACVGAGVCAAMSCCQAEKKRPKS